MEPRQRRCGTGSAEGGGGPEWKSLAKAEALATAVGHSGMAELAVGELDSLPVPLDFGPVLKSATQVLSKRNSKRTTAQRSSGNAARHNDRETHTLTKKHPSVKHLYKCELKHRWQWVPEKRLCSLWHDLSNEERAQVVQTHERDQLTKSFCEDLEAQMHAVECFASDAAKNTLASMIWCDQSGLALFKRIFIIAVEQNHPMVIDMEVIAAVDAVIQDFCASVVKYRQSRWWPWSCTMAALMLMVLLCRIFAAAWTWVACLIAVCVVLHSVWRSLPPLDPRSFAVGTELWVQYREREHVRLMWMSATVRVFEVRLLRILERRRRAAKQDEASKRLAIKAAAAAAASTSSATPASAAPSATAAPGNGSVSASQLVSGGSASSPSTATAATAAGAAAVATAAAPKKRAAQKRPPRQRKPMSSKEAEEVESEEVAQDEKVAQPPKVEEASAVGVARSAPAPPLPPPVRPLQPLSLEAQLEGPDDVFSEGEFCNVGDGDEIDAEFARRVQEHFQNRVQAAGKDLHSQTERGNQILKTLCEKLKTELERTSVPAGVT